MGPVQNARVEAEDEPRRRGTLAPPPANRALVGLSEAEAQRRLQAAGRPRQQKSSRSYASIVRANVLTVFNVILAGFGAVTLIFGDARDALFLGIIVANAGIGNTQEVRAKRALDRLSLLVAPHARVRRDGAVRQLAVDEVVVGDVVMLEPGDQVIADGRLLAASDLRLDESILSGESETVSHAVGEGVRSGAFVAEGTGGYEVTAVGADSFAARLTGEARSFRHPRSPLERAINRLLYALVGLVLGLGAILGYSLYHRHIHLHTAVATSSAGVVSLIPEGLVLLVSLTYAAAAVRMSRRGVLAQQLNAIESLASVDTIGIDKTGTLTEAALRVIEVIPTSGTKRGACSRGAQGAGSRRLGSQHHAPGDRGRRARGAAAGARRGTFLQPAALERGLGSRRKLVSGRAGARAGRIAGERGRDRQHEGRRVLAIARDDGPLPKEAGDHPPPGLEPLGLVVLAEQLRPNVTDTIAFLRGQGVEVKVLSGDDQQTVAAIARDVGIPVAGVHEGSDIPDDPQARGAFARDATVVGRISPEGKRAIVQALRDEGRYDAMVGDGVNDVPALKSSRLAPLRSRSWSRAACTW